MKWALIVYTLVTSTAQFSGGVKGEQQILSKYNFPTVFTLKECEAKGKQQSKLFLKKASELGLDTNVQSGYSCVLIESKEAPQWKRKS